MNRSQAAARQQITPELRQWIVQQAQQGHPVESVLKSMLASGWSEDVAVEAMESTLRRHLEEQTRQNAAEAALPPALPVPEPALEGSPLYLDLGDRRVHVLQAMQNPRVVLFGDFLSEAECEGLIALATPRLARSLTVATKTGGEEVNEDRTSNGMFFRRGETELIERVESRIARLINWPVENGEGLQILQYGPGAEYKAHYDYFDPREPGTATILRRGGQRVGTVVMYLGEPEKGGGTLFPEIQFEASPKRGNALFFSYDRPHPSTRTLHAGAPVLAGVKWIATKWLRERRFD